jgi:hypothetical protein
MPAIRTNHLTEPTVTRPDDLDSLRVPAILSIATRTEYLVRQRADTWLIEHAGDEYGPYKNRQEAMFFAIDAAHKLGERGRKTSVRLIDHAGRAVNTWTYGTDPYPPFF